VLSGALTSLGYAVGFVAATVAVVFVAVFLVIYFGVMADEPDADQS
jgi:hypothetical protein